MDTALIDQLRQRIASMESAPARLPLPTHPALAPVLQLRAGGSYGVDSASLGLALLAEASRQGEWVAVAGWPDLGMEAAAALGLDLERTVWVPDLGEHWLEVTAALIDAVRLVLLRPPAGLDATRLARPAAQVEARLRKRSGALVVWGEWPRCDARISIARRRWHGLGQGHGVLRDRRLRVEVTRGTAPAVSQDVVWGADTLRIAGPAVPAAPVAAGRPARPWLQEVAG